MVVFEVIIFPSPFGPGGTRYSPFLAYRRALFDVYFPFLFRLVSSDRVVLLLFAWLVRVLLVLLWQPGGLGAG